MTAILGISAFYHDSAAALVVDGEVRAAVQEERLTRIKHHAGFPYRAIETCLDNEREARFYKGNSKLFRKSVLRMCRECGETTQQRVTT